MDSASPFRPDVMRPLVVAATAVWGLIAALLSASCAQASVPVAPSPTFRMLTSSEGSGGFRLGSALADAVRSAGDTFNLQVVPTAGSVESLRAVEAGEADFAITFADVGYMAVAGRLDEARGPFAEVRAVALIDPTLLHIVVRATSPIQTARDLKGRRVGIGGPGSGSALAAMSILRAAGVPKEFVRIDSTLLRDTPTLLAANRIDAILVISRPPYQAVIAAMRNGGRLVPVEGDVVQRLRTEHPFVFPTSIPPNTYPGQAAPVHTIGIDGLLVCRRELDERIVYRLTHHLFETLRSHSLHQTLSQGVTLAEASATPIPLHAGAARFYRGRVLFR